MPTGAAIDSAGELGGLDRSGRSVVGGSYATVGFAGLWGGPFAVVVGEGANKLDWGTNANGGS